MKSLPIFLGVVVVVIFSFWPLQVANAVCCLGVSLGAGLGVYMVGQQQGNMMEPTEGMRLGILIGVIAALVVLLLNLFFQGIGFYLAGPSPYVDALPAYMYNFLIAMWEGFLEYTTDQRSNLFTQEPGVWWRFVFNLLNNILFGAFGGAVAASLFPKEPPLE